MPRKSKPDLCNLKVVVVCCIARSESPSVDARLIFHFICWISYVPQNVCIAFFFADVLCGS